MFTIEMEDGCEALQKPCVVYIFLNSSYLISNCIFTLLRTLQVFTVKKYQMKKLNDISHVSIF